MKKLLKIVFLTVITLGIVFFLGPRPEVVAENSFLISSLGDNLDQYLAEREANVPNLIKGTEKEIIWAKPSNKEQTDIAIVYLHGFSSSKPELRPVPDMVAQALDANIYYTRFVGSGRDMVGMEDASISAWVSDYAEAIAIGERIGKKIIIIATSNGASISTYCLNNKELSKNIIGFISVSAAFELQRVSNFFANIPWAHELFPLMMGNYITWEPDNDEQAKYWISKYNIRSTYPMMALMNQVWHMDKSHLKIPALFVYSPEDLVVRPEAILKTANEWGGEVKTYAVNKTLESRHHIIAGNIIDPENNDEVSNVMIEWIKGL